MISVTQTQTSCNNVNDIYQSSVLADKIYYTDYTVDMNNQNEKEWYEIDIEYNECECDYRSAQTSTISNHTRSVEPEKNIHQKKKGKNICLFQNSISFQVCSGLWTNEQ